MNDVRWKQRFNNYLKAFQTLTDAMTLSQSRKLSSLEQQGLIQSFEFTHELAWNVLKDYLENKGITGLIGSKDATRTAFKNGLIDQGEIWMKMIEDRNLTTHTYQLEIADEVAADIMFRFFPAFQALAAKFTGLSLQPETD
jgi:nucleotidyltransferase substrate binding protein (TIGR01987 family)